MVSLLKGSLLDVVADINSSMGDRDLNLNLKIENFQRKKMFDGLRK